MLSLSTYSALWFTEELFFHHNQHKQKETYGVLMMVYRVFCEYAKFILITHLRRFVIL